MLIHDFIQVPCACHEVTESVLSDARCLLADTASAAYRDGETLSVKLGLSGRHPQLQKQVVVDLGRPHQHGDVLRVPIQWWSTAATALFPRLEGDLEFAPVGPSATHITLSARYDPPLAGVGRAIDRLLLHRVAEASVRSFLTRVAASVSTAVAA